MYLKKNVSIFLNELDYEICTRAKRNDLTKKNKVTVDLCRCLLGSLSYARHCTENNRKLHVTYCKAIKHRVHCIGVTASLQTQH